MHVVAPPRAEGNIQREGKEQAALYRWRDLVAKAGRFPGLDLMFAIPNGAYLQGDARRRAMQWAKLRAQGARAGVSDNLLPVPLSPYAGLWLELKAPKPHAAAVSEEQKEWIARMRAQGYAAHVAYGWQHAVELIEAYYQGRA